MPVHVNEPPALEIVLNQRGIVICKVDPPINGTIGVKLNVFEEFAPVIKLELAYEHDVITDGLN